MSKDDRVVVAKSFGGEMVVGVKEGTAESGAPLTPEVCLASLAAKLYQPSEFPGLCAICGCLWTSSSNIFSA